MELIKTNKLNIYDILKNRGAYDFRCDIESSVEMWIGYLQLSSKDHTDLLKTS